MKLVKVRFLQDAVYRVHGYVHPSNPVYAAGSIHELSEDRAQRWLRRGAAEVIKGKAEPDGGDKLSPVAGAAASPADGDDGGDKPAPDKRGQRKGFARDNR